MKIYIEIVKDIQKHMGLEKDYDPRHILGYILLGYSTLNGLSKKQFIIETCIGMECIDVDGLVNAEKNAQSFCL